MIIIFLQEIKLMSKIAETYHPVNELIAWRWSPYAFTGRPKRGRRGQMGNVIPLVTGRLRMAGRRIP